MSNEKTMTISELRHNVLGGVILVMDICLVITLLLVDHFHHVDSPDSGKTDTSAAIGWIGCMGAIIAFGCYGIQIKKPSIEKAQVDTMVFQCYYSVGVAVFSFLIWIASDVSDFIFSYWGFVFAILWISCSLTSYNAIRALGYAVGPSIWAGLTIVVSFVWGTIGFSDPIKNIGGAIGGLIILIGGICLAAASQSTLPQKLEKKFSKNSTVKLAGDKVDISESENNFLLCDEKKGKKKNEKQYGSFVFGIIMALLTGLANGSLMVPLRCFEHGCLGSKPFMGSEIASLAFLPSLSIGVLVVTPIFFLFYFRFHIPNMHREIAMIPALITGCYWAAGNFCSMWATQFLGQTVGFPLTQTCIVVAGLWGILYFHEIKGIYPVGIFLCAVAIIIIGAILIGNFA